MDLRKFYYYLSPEQRLLARRLYYFPIDLWELVTGKRGSMIPPRGMIFTGRGDFVKDGQRLLDVIVKATGLKSNHRVLDIGSGIGRLAVALTNYLDNDGSYEGFDIVKKGVDWCNRHIHKKYPHFKFIHIDLKNKLYNLKTEAKAESFVFPYPDNDFDCIALISVFTHMTPSDVDNYLGQISRVMKPDGKCFATFFLVNDDIKKKIRSSEWKSFNFPYDYGDYCLLDKNVEEADIAFNEDYLRSLLDKNNLKAETIIRGFWSSRVNTETNIYQDIVVISRKG